MDSFPWPPYVLPLLQDAVNRIVVPSGVRPFIALAIDIVACDVRKQAQLLFRSQRSQITYPFLSESLRTLARSRSVAHSHLGAERHLTIHLSRPPPSTVQYVLQHQSILPPILAERRKSTRADAIVRDRLRSGHSAQGSSKP